MAANPPGPGTSLDNFVPLYVRILPLAQIGQRPQLSKQKIFSRQARQARKGPAAQARSKFNLLTWRSLRALREIPPILLGCVLCRAGLFVDGSETNERFGNHGAADALATGPDTKAKLVGRRKFRGENAIPL
jgi:hypothetical protein